MRDSRIPAVVTPDLIRSPGFDRPHYLEYRDRRSTGIYNITWEIVKQSGENYFATSWEICQTDYGGKTKSAVFHGLNSTTACFSLSTIGNFMQRIIWLWSLFQNTVGVFLFVIMRRFYNGRPQLSSISLLQ